MVRPLAWLGCRSLSSYDEVSEEKYKCELLNQCNIGMAPTTPVRQVMSTELTCASPRSTIKEVEEMFAKRPISGMPVTKDGVLVGVVSRKDLRTTFDHGVTHVAVSAARARLQHVIPPLQTVVPAYQPACHPAWLLAVQRLLWPLPSLARTAVCCCRLSKQQHITVTLAHFRANGFFCLCCWAAGHHVNTCHLHPAEQHPAGRGTAHAQGASTLNP